MTDLFALFTQYGAFGVFFVVLFVQLGLPIPVLPLLLLMGSIAVGNPQLGLASLLLAIIASLLGDFVWYSAGRHFGHRILHLLCRISLSPDSCVRQSETHFSRWGVATLVIAKFIPGLATLAPPLAGALGLRRSSFFIFSTAGAALWAGTWLVVGAIFHQQINGILVTMTEFGKTAVLVICLLLLAYVIFRWWQRYRIKVFARQTKITPKELAELLKQEQLPLIFDARSSLAKSMDLERIIGARPLDPKSLAETIADIPFSQVMVVYCSCPNNDVSAVQVARQLKKRGYTQVRSLQGGIDAWRAEGFSVEYYESAEPQVFEVEAHPKF